MRQWIGKQQTRDQQPYEQRAHEQQPRRQTFAARLRRFGSDAGSATAEYAIATLAAVGFAGLLVVILRSDAVRQMLTDLIHRALTFAG